MTVTNLENEEKVMHALCGVCTEEEFDRSVEFAVISFTPKDIARWEGCVAEMGRFEDQDGWNGPTLIRWADHCVEYFSFSNSDLPDAVFEEVDAHVAVFLSDEEFKRLMPLVVGDLEDKRDWLNSSHVRTECKRVQVRPKGELSFRAYIKDSSVRAYTDSFCLDEFKAELKNHLPVDQALFENSQEVA